MRWVFKILQNAKLGIFVVCLWNTTLVMGMAEAIYPFDSLKQEAQFKYLLRNLRCVVCQNQDLADSNATLAKDLRNDVYLRVKEGMSDENILHYLTDRYGDFILFKPPLKSITVILWCGPILLLIIGGLIFLRTCRKKESIGE